MPQYGWNLNWLDPVNKLHPLNRGLVSWWLAVPGLMGGLTWIDMVDPSNGNHGTLTNMTPLTDWVGSDRPGGWGALDLDGSNDFISAPQIDVVAAMSVSAWIKADQNTNRGDAVTIGGEGWTLRPVATFDVGRLNRPYFWIKDGTGFFEAFDTTVITVGRWYYMLGTYDGETARLYIDGVEADNSPNTGPSGDLVAPTGNTIIGAFSEDQTKNNWNGSLDDIRIWDRALSADEGVQSYLLSQQGYPRLLNRIDRRLFVAVAVPSVVPRLALLGVG